jgi:hypothetical protein
MADGSANLMSGSWATPDDFSSLTSLTCVIRSNGTGNMLGTFTGGASADGENTNADTDTIAETTYAMTANQINFIDATATANGLTIGAAHVLGFTFSRNGGGGADTVGNQVKPIGWIVVYA